MKASTSLILRYAPPAVIAVLVFTGCSKKENPPPAVETPVATVDQPAPAVAQPVAFTGEPQPQQWMTEAQSQQQAGDYDKAAQYLLAIQNQQALLSQQQAAVYWKQMSAFQSDLAARVAAGDPRAKAAAERLRAAATR